MTDNKRIYVSVMYCTAVVAMVGLMYAYNQAGEIDTTGWYIISVGFAALGVISWFVGMLELRRSGTPDKLTEWGGDG